MHDVSRPEARTYQRVLTTVLRKLEAAEEESSRRQAEWILTAVLSCSRAKLYGYPERKVSAEQWEEAERMVQRRLQGEPLQYIIGHTEFYGLRMEVTPQVLIPRPETEQVVEESLRSIQDLSRPRVLDVGTGSGCMAVALARERSDAVVYACDVSEGALEIAARNAAAHEVSVSFRKLDILEDSMRAAFSGPFDLVVSNPPYIPASEYDDLPADVREFEPEEALFCGDDPLLFYRRIAAEAAGLLREGGELVFEVHAPNAEQVADLLRATGFQQVRMLADLAGRTRIVGGRWKQVP